MSRVESYKDYIDAFGVPGTPEGTYMKDSRLAKAYEVALDIRKFEIDLYWKRSGSFWLLVGGITAAFAFVLGGKLGGAFSRTGFEMICFFISLLGCFVCVAWVLVNRGSKFWQRNWELQVQILEDKVIGPLYKSVFAERRTKVVYSVTKINEYIADCFAIMFAASTLFFIVGDDGIRYLRLFLGRHGWWPAGEAMNLARTIFKLVIALLALALAWWVFSRAINDREVMRRNTAKPWNPDLDVEVDVSVRAIKLVEICSSEAANVHWRRPRNWFRIPSLAYGEREAKVD